MRELLGRVVFSVGGAEFTWEDVVLAAESWGDWARLRERAREGVACPHDADALAGASPATFSIETV